MTRRSGNLPAAQEDEQDPQKALDEQLQILLTDRAQPAETRQALREALGEQAIRDKCGIEGIVLKAAQPKEKPLSAQEAPEPEEQAGYHIGQDSLQWAALHQPRTIQLAGLEFQAVTPPPEPAALPQAGKAPEKKQDNANYHIGDDPLDWEPLRLPTVIEQQGMLSTPLRSTGDIEIYYYHTDQLGTPQEVTNEAGEMVWEGKYKAWGGLIIEQEERIDTREMTAAQLQAWEKQKRTMPMFHQPIRFQGQYHDIETGLHYNRFRYYDPDVGRFISQDPIGLEGGNNLYQYAPNPVVWIDPLGLACLSHAVNFDKAREAAFKKAGMTRAAPTAESTFVY